MDIQLNTTCPMHIVDAIDFMIQVRAWYPDLKIKDHCADDIKRIIKKLIKDRSTLMYTHFIFFNANIPLFLYNDLNRIMSMNICKLETINIDDIGFESNTKFSSKEELLLSNLFKKVKSTLKESEVRDWQDGMLYFLPGSTIVNTTIMLTHMDIFKLLAQASNKANTKLHEFGNMLFKVMNGKFPEMFNEYNIEIYLATKES